MQPLCLPSRGEHHAIHVLLVLMLSGGLARGSSCPSLSQRTSLVRSADASSARCHCDADRPSEWEITCIRDTGSISGSDAERYPVHDVPSVGASQPSFVIKFLNSDTIEITCDELVPDFKPAMFQGTNICIPVPL